MDTSRVHILRKVLCDRREFLRCNFTRITRIVSAIYRLLSPIHSYEENEQNDHKVNKGSPAYTKPAIARCAQHIEIIDAL